MRFLHRHDAPIVHSCDRVAIGPGADVLPTIVGKRQQEWLNRHCYRRLRYRRPEEEP